MRRLFDRIERSYDAGVVAAVRSASSAAAALDPGILYLGLNPESATAEKAALAKTGAVREVGVGPAIDGVRYDFAQPSEVKRYVDSLRLDPRVGANIEAALLAIPAHRRPVVAHIARALADGERGGPVPARLVISAHSGGEDFYGNGAGFSATDLQRLAKAMPRAAAQIQDLHFSSCSTSGQLGLPDARNAWLEAFPNLKTMWGYAGYSSLSPTRDLEAWGRATSKPHETLDVPPELKRHHIATWSARAGYHDDISMTDLRRNQATADRRFAALVSGEKRMASFHEDATADYEAYRTLSQRGDVPPADRQVFKQRADQLLRMRYYDEGVRVEFARRHGATVRAGLEALGMKPADFATLDRAHANAVVAELEERMASLNPVPAEVAKAAVALRGLRDLDPRTVFEADCHHVNHR